VVVLIQIIKGMEGKKMVFTMIYLLLSVVRFVINSMTVATQRTIERVRLMTALNVMDSSFSEKVMFSIFTSIFTMGLKVRGRLMGTTAVFAVNHSTLECRLRIQIIVVDGW
jgi:hypothetical protein